VNSNETIILTEKEKLIIDTLATRILLDKLIKEGIFNENNYIEYFSNLDEYRKYINSYYTVREGELMRILKEKSGIP
jgi:hypothetical protein